MADGGVSERAFMAMARRNHELNLENRRLRKMLALALEGLARVERISGPGDPILRAGWVDDRRN